MARLLLLALALALSSTYVQAGPKVIQWNFAKGKPPKYAPITVNLGDKLNFVWTADGTVKHDVVALGANAYKSCAIKEANIGRYTDPVTAASITVTPFGGVSYYTCTVPGHCLAGQKVQVTTKFKAVKGGPTVNWILPGVSGKPFADVKIKQGQTVTFKWSGAVAHDVWLMSGKANYDSCSFKKAIPVSPVPAAKSGTVKVTPPKGTWYFSCSVVGHCGKTGKQKVKVIVS